MEDGVSIKCESVCKVVVPTTGEERDACVVESRQCHIGVRWHGEVGRDRHGGGERWGRRCCEEICFGDPAAQVATGKAVCSMYLLIASGAEVACISLTVQSGVCE